MKTTRLSVIFLLGVLVTGIAPTVFASDEGTGDDQSYFVIKGGLYSPNEKYEINDFNAGTTSHLDPKTGLNGEIALGEYSEPDLAVELGIGYFESKGAPAGEPGSTRLTAVPVVVTAKGFVPMGALAPYLEVGVGLYLTKLEASGNTGSFSSRSKNTVGMHAGAGFNIDLSRILFIGLESRYLWVKPDYGGQTVKLNGFATTIDLGFRY